MNGLPFAPLAAAVVTVVAVGETAHLLCVDRARKAGA